MKKSPRKIYADISRFMAEILSECIDPYTGEIDVNWLVEDTIDQFPTANPSAIYREAQRLSGSRSTVRYKG
jgi:hypothetical protein